MKLHLAILTLLLAASSCFAYEVVLKNGKILRGEIISDKDQILTLKDTSGIQLKIRHEQIDSAKTEERNPVAETPVQQKAPAVEQEKTPAEKPKTKGRVYTKDDLEKMPELSIVGTKESADEVAAKNKLENEANKEEPHESEWSEEALRIDDEIQRAKDAYEYNKSLCDKVIPDVTDLRDGYYVKMTAEQYEEERRYACAASDQDEKDLQKAEADLEHLREKARKAGIDPGLVDPEWLRNH